MVTTDTMTSTTMMAVENRCGQHESAGAEHTR